MRDSSTAFGAALGGLVALAVGLGVGRFVYTPILPFMTALLVAAALTARLRP